MIKIMVDDFPNCWLCSTENLGFRHPPIDAILKGALVQDLGMGCESRAEPELAAARVRHRGKDCPVLGYLLGDLKNFHHLVKAVSCPGLAHISN